MKKIKKMHAICALLMLISLFLQWDLSIAQQSIIPCLSSDILNKNIQKDSSILTRMKKLETFTANYINNMKQQRIAGADSDTTIYIPLVFHILHEYGTENISDLQVADEMRILNEDWAKLNLDTADIIPQFKQIASSTHIQFRLANIDPEGNCTNGIEHIYTYLTNSAGDNAKIHQWDPTMYANVWVAKALSQGNTGTVNPGAVVLGYAYFPAEMPSTPPNPDGGIPNPDGVMITNQAIGSIGTAYDDASFNPSSWSRCLTHELGHYFNLEHPWGNNNLCETTCGTSGVDDVPETKGYFGVYTAFGIQSPDCPTDADTNLAKICNPPTAISPGIVENWQNFMDYSFCSRMFTNDQYLRIWAAANSPQASRNNLWTSANLAATGTATPSPANVCVPNPDFYANACFVCQGDTVGFNDASWNGPVYNRTWSFSGGTANSNTSANPIVKFDSLYWQTASLTTSNYSGSATNAKNNYVYVSPPWTDYNGTFTEGFENSGEFNSNWIVVNQFNTSSTWQLTSSASHSGTSCIMLNAYSQPVYSGGTLVSYGIGPYDIDALISPSTNLTHATGLSLNFWYSIATLASLSADITDTLTVWYSLNCGQTWNLLSTMTGGSFINNGYTSVAYTPTATSTWTQKTIPLTAALAKPNVRFKLSYQSGFYSNNLYVDDFNVSGVNGMEQYSNSDGFDFSIFPNPANESATITYRLQKAGDVTLELLDIVGKSIHTVVNPKQDVGTYHQSLNLQGLADGIYFVKLIANESSVATRKLIVTQSK